VRISYGPSRTPLESVIEALSTRVTRARLAATGGGRTE
jgi:hypothetical protein